MNFGVRIACLFGALVALTLVVYVPWVRAGLHPGQFLGFAPVWSDRWRTSAGAIAVGHVAVGLFAVALAIGLVCVALWNWPNRHGARPDADVL